MGIILIIIIKLLSQLILARYVLLGNKKRHNVEIVPFRYKE